VDPSADGRLQRLLDEREIRDVLSRYCRGVDRRDLELVRRCYHPDATDDHGAAFTGGVDDFLTYAASSLARYESTMHKLGQVLVEPDADDPDRARSEVYAIAFHRLAATDRKPARDVVVGLRYIDDFERRGGEWRIARRVCALDWSRMDPAGELGWPVPRDELNGRPDGDDPVFRR
jgi:hypothetical protein